MAKHGGSFSRQSPMVDPSHFAMIPRADIPRSVFKVDYAHKTTFNIQDLVPVYCEEVLPGDSFRVQMTAFTRISTMLFPLMDGVELCSFFFYVPCRLLWSNWQKFMGQQTNPGDSTSFLVPIVDHNLGGAAPTRDSVYDHFGLPIQLNSLTVGVYSHNALPLRAYNLIWNEWFRDQNLQNSVTVPTGDGPDTPATYTLLKRNKRHDYFTSALPFAQKGNAATLPVGSQAPIIGLGFSTNTLGGVNQNAYETTTGLRIFGQASHVSDGSNDPAGQQVVMEQDAATGFPKIFADLSSATAITINALRQAFQIQKLLERDARGGTRYTEILRAHFGVLSPDARLQRPEYLGGGCSPININPVAQTSVTAATPQGNLAGVGHGVAQHGFSKSFVEHGYIIGMVAVRANITYQQGLQRMWSRRTKYDFYWPAFAHLGEQTILNKEIFLIGGGSAADNQVFGYQERWGEYRYKQSLVTAWFRSGRTGTLDAWHLSEFFASAPALNATFISGTTPMSRVLAAGTGANGFQFLFDSLFDIRMARPLPMYSVPGFVDRF